MNLYKIDKESLTVISGPHDLTSDEIKTVFSCGNPDVLYRDRKDLFDALGYVPEVMPIANEYMGVDGTYVVYPDKVQFNLVPKPVDMLIGEYTLALEEHYDAVAKKLRYDSRYTCALRAAYPSVFQQEGLAFATWMDACNAYAYTVMNDVMSGKRAMPSKEELLAEIPEAPW